MSGFEDEWEDLPGDLRPIGDATSTIFQNVLDCYENPATLEKAQRGTAYDEYLRSPAWRAKRQQALSRARFKCQQCGTSGNLQVHHLTYDRVGNENLFDLMVLCGDCHGEQHGFARQRRFESKRYADGDGT